MLNSVNGERSTTDFTEKNYKYDLLPDFTVIVFYIN